jgi:hypothetical protein
MEPASHHSQTDAVLYLATREGEVVKGKNTFLLTLLVTFLIIGAGYLVLRGFARSTNIPAGSDFSISLERTACFGFCPVYQITVESNGTVTYQGEMFVAVEGEQSSQISQDQIRQIARQLESIDFLSLQDEYTDRGATDMPSAILTLQVNGETKRVVHYHGDFSAPEKLTRLENLIDEITNSTQWVESSAS